MSLTNALKVGCLLCIVAIVCLSPTTLSAQTDRSADSQRDETLRQLLTEVRELRLALQRATVANTRFQMLTARLKTQQTEVDKLGHELATARSELAKLRSEKTEAAARIKDLEERVDQSSGEERATIERTLKGLKQWLESKTGEEQQQVLAESEFSSRLQVEQARLNDLNNQLDALMNQLNGP